MNVCLYPRDLFTSESVVACAIGRCFDAFVYLSANRPCLEVLYVRLLVLLMLLRVRGSLCLIQRAFWALWRG